jgi:hypothetical protein
MNRSVEAALMAATIVLLLGLGMSWVTRRIHSKCRAKVKGGESVERLPGGMRLGLLECFFFFAVLSVPGLEYLAGAWLVFKVATKWESARWSQMTPAEARVGYRGFQVGTIGNLLVGVIGAALLRIYPTL